MPPPFVMSADLSSSTLRFASALALLVALASLTGGPADARSSSGGLPDVTLSMSVMSMAERDGSTEVTVTAALLQPVTWSTTILLALKDSPLLTPGITRGAVQGTDYTTVFKSNTITIAPGSLAGETTFTIDPTYDTRVEGDEAVVLTGSAVAAGLVVAPTDLIIEDGHYLSFPKYIYGSLHYADQPLSITVDEASNQAAADSTVTYALTRTEPAGNPLGLTFNPATRQLTGTAPPAAGVPGTGLTTRYTITARDSAGHEATTLISVAVVNDVCSSTATTWFHATDQPPADLIRDCNVLLAARDTLRGTGTLNWGTDTLITTPWDGIEFHHDIKWIRKIELQLRNLNGTIPPVLGHLSSPGSLDLVLGGDHRSTDPSLENKLTGPIPPELGLPPNLIVLSLSYNNLSGPIPRELANNGKLRFLYLHDTDKPAFGATGPEPPGVSGPIPPELGDLPMRGLTISGNPGVTGHIPWQLGKNVSSDSHPGLQVLNLYSNSLEGNIPWQLGRFGKIQQLGLSGNQLTGGIPWQLGELGKEEAAVARRTVGLYLNANRLTGNIPPELGGIANLAVLSLTENRLTGSIPPELGGLPKLQYLYLRDNQLTGSIPQQFGNLGTLIELFLDDNQLDGHIPAGLGQLAELRVLSVERNDLSGPVPAELGNLAKLAGLFLDGNQLTGVIPAELGLLSQLQVLSLACNDLSGAVPASIGAITTLTELNLQGNLDMASDIGERPDNLQRAGLTTTWAGGCHIDVVVWRSVRQPERHFVSIRLEGQRWTTTAQALELSMRSTSGRFSRSSAVPLEIDLGANRTVSVDVVLWCSMRHTERCFVSIRPEDQGWTTYDTPFNLLRRSTLGHFDLSSSVRLDVDLR